ncbi:MAG: TetR/AcrR family transcriptional regulator [Actinobacteria bacterium]|nr:TetR/AcrR family transcriptional regulator [Actinomycetota bacterium]
MPRTSTPRPRGRPRKAEPERPSSRDELLTAAGAVFGRRGYERATVDEIVAEAGLSKGTFYWNFDSKEALFLALLDERVDRPAREVIEITRTSPAEIPTAGAVSAGLASLFSAQAHLMPLMVEYWAEAARNERVAELYRARQAVMRDALSEALTERMANTGASLTMPAADLAEAFLALAAGLALDAIVDPGAVRADLFGQILSLVYDGMVAQATPHSK